MEEQDITHKHIVDGLSVLAENQNRINQKVDSILEFIGSQHNQISNMKETIDKHSLYISYLREKIDNITLTLSDLQIQYQNASSETEGLGNGLSDISMQIEELKQLLNEWKFYQEL
jgi:archaellum component FlaC